MSLNICGLFFFLCFTLMKGEREQFFMLSVKFMDTLNKQSKTICIYTYVEKSEREQMCFINYTWLTLIKTNSLSTFSLYFSYPKYENIFEESTDKPKQEKNVFN